MQTLQSGGAGAALAETIRIYWSYFDPSFLFVQGGNSRNLSTGNAGVFLMPVAVLAPLGLYHLREHRLVRMLVVIGLLAAPLPAVIKGAPYAIQRASGLLIYVSLLAGFGLASVGDLDAHVCPRDRGRCSSSSWLWQFANFYRDYQGSYRIGSAYAYDPTAFREAAESIIGAIGQAPLQAVYMPAGFYDAGAKWRFYTLKHDRHFAVASHDDITMESVRAGRGAVERDCRTAGSGSGQRPKDGRRSRS